MNTCRTCEFWKSEKDDDRTAECALKFFVRNSSEVVADEGLDKMVHYSGGEYDYFETGRNFGCIHHQPKEQ